MTDVSSLYRQKLEEDVISRLAEMKNITLDRAMDIYYRSRLAGQISEGLYGIEYLSPEYLAQDLVENEPELFANG